MDARLSLFIDLVIARRDAGQLTTAEAALMISDAISNW